jgi:small subunit ribosomal protein S16
VATKIKLMRLGKMRDPHYRIVVADSRTKRDGRAIETIGEYHPKNDPSVIRIDSDRAAYWLGVGAQPTEAVAAILKVTGDWQKFKGEPAPAPMRVAEPKPDKQSLFNAALAQVEGEPATEATTPRKRAAKKAAPAAEAPAEPAAAEAPAAPAAEAPAAPAAEAPAAPAAEAPAAPAAAADAPAEPAAAAEAPAPDAPAETPAAEATADESTAQAEG